MVRSACQTTSLDKVTRSQVDTEKQKKYRKGSGKKRELYTIKGDQNQSLRIAFLFRP